jgi:serine/threonine protein kinase/tetratricopeptide (TPR) repeat protein
MQQLTPERWRRIESVLDTALELPPEQRADYLHTACGEDTGMRAHVERLLAADEALDRSTEGPGAERGPKWVIAQLAHGALATLSIDLRAQLQVALGDAYRIEAELPPGGMGRLFLATEISIARQVVIKVLPPEMASGTSAARFRREMEVAARLQHPHILPVLQASARDDLLYYLMPYVRGESLRQRLAAGGPVDVADAVRLLAEIADGLAYAHTQGVVHRDVKPENILLVGEHAALTDFGVTRAIAGSGAESLTATGASLGTPGYMAPEQIAGSGELDGRADVYALAVVGYEMLAGARPFAAQTPPAELAAQMSNVPPLLEQRRAGVPSNVSAAIQRGLATDPGTRFSTASEFRDALLAPPPPMKAWTRRGKPIAVLTVVGALLLVSLWLWRRAPAASENPRTSYIIFPFRNLMGDPSSAWLERAAPDLIGLSLSHWKDLRVFDDERMMSLLRRAGIGSAGALDFDLAQRLARDAGMGTMILGDIARERDSLVITAKVHDVASGERISTEVVRGAATNDPRVLFDSLVTRLLSLSPTAGGVSSDVAAQSTRSVEAYRAYLAGTEALYRGGGIRARALLDQAIALDSSFAIAYVQRANAEGRSFGGGDTALRRALVLKAAQLGTKLPPRDKLLVEVQIAMHDRRFAQARALAAQLVALDSTDAEAWHWRGEVEMRSGTRTYPHADTLADLSSQIRYMRRAIALDSTFLQSYGQLILALIACSNPNTPWACFDDSTAYGTPHDLRLRFGDRKLDSLRAHARAQVLPMIRRWMTADATGLASRRSVVIPLLVMLGHADEADAQLTRFRLLGGDSLTADMLGAIVRLGQDRIAEAASMMRALLREPPETLSARRIVYEARLQDIAPIVLAATGRFTEARGLLRDVSDPRRWPASNGDMVPLSEALQREYIVQTLGASFTNDARTAREALRGLYDALRTRFASEWSTLPSLVNRSAAPLVAYLQTRDTTILHDWIAASDTAPPRAVGALLALARGDTSGARTMAAQFFDPSPFPEWPLAGGADVGPAPHYSIASLMVADAFAWGDALSRLGDRRRAVQAFAKLDAPVPQLAYFRADPRWLLVVRSWFERGRLYEQMGDTAHAVAMYEKFINAWREADPPLQPLVREAREGMARLGRHRDD